MAGVVTRTLVEVLSLDTVPARTTRVLVEVLSLPSSNARCTRVIAEVLTWRDSPPVEVPVPATYEITVDIKKNGARLAEFPLVKRVTVDVGQDIESVHPDDAANTSLADDYVNIVDTTKLTHPQFILVQAVDGQLRVHPATVDDGGALYPFVLASGGFLLAVGLDPADAGTTGFKTCNNTGGDVTERVIVGADS